METFTHTDERKQVVLQPCKSCATVAGSAAKKVVVVVVIVAEFVSFYSMSLIFYQLHRQHKISFHIRVIKLTDHVLGRK